MKLNKAAAAALAGTLIGVTSYSAVVPTQVQAKASYKVQITKNASVYTSKGKKTKTVYKKDKVLTAYKVRKIKGKYYYDLGKGKYVRTSYAMKYYYRTTTQSKKLVRTIKLYQPKGTKVVKQNAYVKRTVKQNLKTKKKTYGKWGSASWKAYKAPAVSGYTASPKQVAKETVYSWSKNKTVKVKYKKASKKSSKKPSSTSSAQSNPASPKGTASKPSASNSSASASTSSKTFSVDLINEQTIYDGDDEKNEHPETVYGVTYYKKSGNIFSNAGDDIIYQKTVTVTETAYDAKGNCYYKINEARDADSAWILDTDTNKRENTLKIAKANFNVIRNKRAHIATYDLLADNSLNRNGETVTMEAFESAYYPVICHVYATGKDRNGVEWYKITIPSGKGVSGYCWVKASEFETTNQPEGHTHPTFEWTEYWQKKTAEDFLSYLNQVRAEAGNGAKPLTMATDKQAELDALVKKQAEKYAETGELEHTAYVSGRTGENLSAATCFLDSSSVSSSRMEELLLSSFRDVTITREKSIYDQGVTKFNMENGHYWNVINPEYTKVCISSAPAIINGKVHLIEYQEFWK